MELWAADAARFIRAAHPTLDAWMAARVYADINGFTLPKKPTLRAVALTHGFSHEWVRRLVNRVAPTIEQMSYPEDFSDETQFVIGAVKERIAALCPGVVGEIGRVLRRDGHLTDIDGAPGLIRLCDHLKTNTHALSIEQWQNVTAIVTGQNANCWRNVHEFAMKVIRASGAVSSKDVAQHFDLSLETVRNMLAPFLREVRHTMSDSWMTCTCCRWQPRDIRRRSRYWHPVPQDVLSAVAN